MKRVTSSTELIRPSALAAANCCISSGDREAVILVGASGFAYEEAAVICGCAVGTIKSRVNRARTRLAEMLKISGDADFGPDEDERKAYRLDAEWQLGDHRLRFGYDTETFTSRMMARRPTVQESFRAI